MNRNLRAALLATVIVAGAIAGLGIFLGLPAGGSVAVGVVAGLLSGLLLHAAGRRAETFHPTDPNAHLADHRGGGTPADDQAPHGAARPQADQDDADRSLQDLSDRDRSDSDPGGSRPDPGPQPDEQDDAR